MNLGQINRMRFLEPVFQLYLFASLSRHTQLQRPGFRLAPKAGYPFDLAGYLVIQVRKSKEAGCDAGHITPCLS